MSTSDTADVYGAACAYIARGWPVFLLGRTKRPVANCPACQHPPAGHDPEACSCLTCHGFYAATHDPARLATMLRAVPYGLLAIRTGQPSGVVVVDLDPDHGGTVDPTLMPPTLSVRTGSGGWHLYYRHPATPVPCSQSRIAPGVDVRGDGGYAVVPPSIHPRTHQPYQWGAPRPVAEMSAALHAACQPLSPTSGPAAVAATATTPGGGISSPAALLAAHLRAVAHAPEGRRRTTLYGAARGVARMVAAGALTRTVATAALTEAGRAAGQTERETRAAIAGGFRDEGVSA
jgi:hypothetical protein